MAAAAVLLLMIGTGAEGSQTAAKVRPTKRAVDSYCTKTRRTCTEVYKRDGKFAFVLQTERRSLDTYRLCVTNPNGNQRCHKYPVNIETRDSFAGVVPFKAEYPHRVKGTYGVSWRNSGNRIGPVLHFNFR